MRAVSSLFAVGALGVASAAVAQDYPMFAVVDGYVRQVTDAAVDDAVRGPETFTLGRDQSEKPVTAPLLKAPPLMSWPRYRAQPDKAAPFLPEKHLEKSY